MEKVADKVDDRRWESVIKHGPDAVDALRRLTPLSFMWMEDYPDYFPEVDGGSATGRAVEPKPFDAKELGEDRDLLLPPVMAAPFPMPVTGKSYRWMNLVTRKARGVATGAQLLGMGVGGMALGREYIAGGQALAAGMIAGLLALDVEIWTDSGLTDLVLEDGRVVGVLVDHEGEEVRVNARKGVILAAGGFDRDAEMRRQYQSEKVDGSWSFGTKGDSGEVINIAHKHGADLAFMDQAWWFPAINAPGEIPGTMLAERSLPGQIIVDGDGNRYMNEAVNYMTAGQIITALDEEGRPTIPSWQIFDQRYRNRYLYGGGIFPGQKLPKEWYEAGIARKADTIEELAEELGMADLPATVERFNLLANSGHDDDFKRGDSAYDRYYGDPTIFPNPCLGPIDKGPFYAVQVVPGDLGTCGGIRADKYGRVLDENRSVIEGLYAVGNAAGNAYGEVYPGPGATIGQGLVFGYLAAQHAAGALE